MLKSSFWSIFTPFVTDFDYFWRKYIIIDETYFRENSQKN